MNLLVRIVGLDVPAWEGYQFRIVPQAAGKGRAALCAWRGGRWKKALEIPCVASENFVELAMPLARQADPLEPLQVEFKWFDHMPEPLDVLDFQDHGDTAPNNRFRYAFEFRHDIKAP